MRSKGIVDSDLLSTINKHRVQNLRALAAQFKPFKEMATKIGWTDSYLHQLFGPNPIRPVTERTARHIERKLGLREGALDQESAVALEVATNALADPLESLMTTIDRELRASDMLPLRDEKYRALVTHLFRFSSKGGEVPVDVEEVRSLLRLLR